VPTYEITVEILKKSGFKLIEDGSILAGYGSAHIGMAQIKVWIENTAVDRIEFILSSEQIESKDTSSYWNTILEKDKLAYFSSAIFSGAEETYLQASFSSGIKFVLINAMGDIFNVNEMYFKLAGKIALSAWYQLQSNPTDISLTYSELYQIQPHLFRSPYDEEI
jgi:hypothetical protein